MWEEVSRDILKIMHRQNTRYRIIDRNGRESAKMVVPMEGNSVSAASVEDALNQCELATGACINMLEARLEFELGTKKTDCDSKIASTRNLKFRSDLLSDDDLADVETVAHKIIQSSTTGVIPRIELSFIEHNCCVLYACNQNCVFNHNSLCEELDASRLTYNFNTKEIMYTLKLSATKPQKRRKKDN